MTLIITIIHLIVIKRRGALTSRVILLVSPCLRESKLLGVWREDARFARYSSSTSEPASRVMALYREPSNIKNMTRRVLFFILVIPAGVEPAIFWMRTRRPGPLDDGTNNIYILSFFLSFDKSSFQSLRNML